MKNNLIYYFFDVDGTLLCHGGKKLQKGVTSLLESINNCGGQVVFISASNYLEIKNFLQLVYQNSNLNEENFHPIIASNGGSFIKEFDIYMPIDSSLFKKVKRVVNYVDPSAIFVLRTQNNTFVDSALDAESMKLFFKKSGKKIATEILVKLNRFTLNAIVLREPQIDALLEKNLILSMNIISLKSKEIAFLLEKKISGISVSASGPYVDFSRANKLDVIKFFVNKYNLLQENCAMFGDSYNDTDALCFCGFGALCNPKRNRLDLVEKVTAQPNHYATFDLTRLIDAATNQEFDSLDLLNETTQVHKAMKKPNGRTFVK